MKDQVRIDMVSAELRHITPELKHMPKEARPGMSRAEYEHAY
jgi:hypothetical protein